VFRLPALRLRWLVGAALLAVACSSAPLSSLSPEPLASATSPSTVAAQTPTPSVKVPKLVGLTLAKARGVLESLGFDVRVKRNASGTRKPGTILAQSLRAGRRVGPGTTVTLTVAKAKPKPPPPASSCDPNYAGQCLDPNAYDYDCGGGSGDGPKYVYGTVRVVGYDHYGLDRDNDGIGCE
jgi:resuscitation-promoting factor RpfB